MRAGPLPDADGILVGPHCPHAGRPRAGVPRTNPSPAGLPRDLAGSLITRLG